MILCYSGTGNSRYIAKKLAALLGDELLDLNKRIKENDTAPVQVNGRLVVVTPTYAWRIPRIARDWLRKTELVGVEGVWFIMSCGSEIGSAAKYSRELCDEKKLGYMGTMQIVMPENYIAMFDAPEVSEAKVIVAAAEPLINQAAELISEGSEFPAPRDNLYDRFLSGPVNPIFYSFFVKASAFAASDACIGCGLCAKLCPTNSVTLQDGRPVWGDGCTHCMACICYCPAKAIEYGRKSLGKPRYHIEAVVDK